MTEPEELFVKLAVRDREGSAESDAEWERDASFEKEALTSSDSLLDAEGENRNDTVGLRRRVGVALACMEGDAVGPSLDKLWVAREVVLLRLGTFEAVSTALRL